VTPSAGSSRILVVEDDAALGERLRALLEADGFAVALVRDAGAARRAADASVPDVVLLDLEPADGDALALIADLRDLDGAAVVVLARRAGIDTALAGVRGAAQSRRDGAEGRTARDAPPGPADDLRLEMVVRRHVERVLRLERGRVDRAAARLAVPRSTLYQRLKEYGLSPAAFRRGKSGSME
jgi:DNA-binding NtrC family response regulator